MHYINDEFWEQLIDHKILVEAPITKKEDENWADFYRREQEESNAWTGAGGKFRRNYKINPLVPKYPITLNFSDVVLDQAINKVESRSHVSTKTEALRGVTLDVPVIASNMSTVTNAKFCNLIEQLGGLGILHRAWKTDEEYLQEVTMMTSHAKTWQNKFAASVGVGYDQLELAKKLIQKGINIICIDIAHGFSEEIKLMAISIKRYSKDTKVIVGNVINPEAVEYYDNCADAIKFGIANGLACQTKNTAGCNAGQFSAVNNAAERAKTLELPIISDGGVREPSDLGKGVGAGANSVMIGSLFAACPESAAEVVNGKKVYAGMASAEVMQKWGKESTGRVEGKVVELEIGKNLEGLMNDFVGALKSSITYAGAVDIDDFQKKARFSLVLR